MQEELTENKGSDEVLKISNDIPNDISNNVFLNIKSKKQHPIHSIGNPHPAKFLAMVPRWGIKKYSSENNIILDPFVGSGTTLIEARLLHRNCYGIDNNPLARLISKVKSTPLNYSELIHSKKCIEEKILNLKDIQINIPCFINRDFWFDKESTNTIALIKKLIEEEIRDDNVKDFFKVILSEVIRKVSKVSDGQVLPAKRDNKKKAFTKKETISIFFSILSNGIEIMKSFSSVVNERNFSLIIGNDARKIEMKDEIDMIITSPPYINSHHYIWSTKLRLLQLEMVDDKLRLELMKSEIGTEEFCVSDYKKLGKTGIDELDEKIEKIFYGENYKATQNQNKIRARSTYQYFIDMKKCFQEFFKVLKNESYFIIIIGNGNICKVNIPTTKYLEELAQNEGFSKILKYNILLKNRTLNIPRNVPWADILDYDSVIVFKKQ